MSILIKQNTKYKNIFNARGHFVLNLESLRMITFLLVLSNRLHLSRVNNVIVLNVFCLALYFSKHYIFGKIMGRTICFKHRPILQRYITQEIKRFSFLMSYFLAFNNPLISSRNFFHRISSLIVMFPSLLC